MKRQYKNKIWKFVKVTLGRFNYERLRMFYNLKYWPSLKNPTTFNEHIVHKKLYGDMDFAIKLADKYEVRDYVIDKVGEEYLPRQYYVGANLDGVNWDDMPNQFVIKTTHGGGDEGNVFVFDKETMDLPEITKKTNTNLKKRFGYWTNEDWYLKIPPRVVIEELMLDDKNGIPSDYKFFCFSGKAYFIQINSSRYESHKRSFYNVDWELQNFSMGYIPSTKIPKPENLSEMIKLAEKLSEDFDFIRVDLYSLPVGIRFGELTFTPGGGHEFFSSRKVDEEWGKLVKKKASP